MRLRNGEHGYGIVTKVLHWVTVLALTAQFTIGLWVTNAGGARDQARDAVDTFEDRGHAAAEARGEAAKKRFEAEVDRRREAAGNVEDVDPRETFVTLVSGRGLSDGVTGLEAHLMLGLLIVLLAAARVAWRRTPLPPWAEHLSDRERAVEGRLEKAMVALLFVVPASGLLLALVSDDLLPLHVTAQVSLLSAVAAHVALVLRHTVLRRNAHLARML